MKIIILAVLIVVCNARAVEKRAAIPPQSPPVWDALRVLNGGKEIWRPSPEIQAILAAAVPGKDYPINAVIPPSNVVCSSYKQPGYYVDTSSPSNCQAFHICDPSGVRTDYLCPNASLFNQITLVCDWFYNVDCASSAQFFDYSNSRIGLQDDQGHYAVLLDNQG